MRPIDADALREEVEFHVTSVSVCATAEQARGMTKFKQICLRDIDNAPTIDAVVPKNTRFVADANRENHWHCEACGFTTGMIWRFYNFCPCCGSIIQKGQEG